MASPVPPPEPVFITQPLINGIPPHLLPRFDPTYVSYYNKYNAGRLHTHQVPISSLRTSPSTYITSYGRDPGPAVFRITHQKCPVEDGEITIRIFEPAEVDRAVKRPAYINYHGGGWVFGGLETDDAFCRRVCVETGAVVFDVDYRLAPEYPFPIPIDDSWAAFEWIRTTKQKEFNIETSKLAIGGISAGGHIAAIIALKCRDKNIPLAFQLLAVPVTDLHGVFTPSGELRPDCPHESYREMWDTVALPGERMSYFHKHFLGLPRKAEWDDPTKPTYWHISPLQHNNFSALAPALLITAEMDPLRDEGEAYALKMREAGCQVQSVRVKGAPHIFMQLDEILEIGRFYNHVSVEALKRAFGV
ncbi:alpha/beta hydrolase fold-domain-containing protein [Delphinella strobiligena]|nr:alpha/beta hydrolase fold-domain-containing protein [Delphinella strobiligena]